MTYIVTVRVEEEIHIEDAMNLEHAEQLAKERFDPTSHSPEVIESYTDNEEEGYHEF